MRLSLGLLTASEIKKKICLTFLEVTEDILALGKKFVEERYHI